MKHYHIIIESKYVGQIILKSPDIRPLSALLSQEQAEKSSYKLGTHLTNKYFSKCTYRSIFYLWMQMCLCVQVPEEVTSFSIAICLLTSWQQTLEEGNLEEYLLCTGSFVFCKLLSNLLRSMRFLYYLHFENEDTRFGAAKVNKPKVTEHRNSRLKIRSQIGLPTLKPESFIVAQQLPAPLSELLVLAETDSAISQ